MEAMVMRNGTNIEEKDGPSWWQSQKKKFKWTLQNKL